MAATAGGLALPHGLHERVPEAVYHGRILGLASKTALDIVHRSPAHYKAWIASVDDEPPPAMRLGSALHCAVLEPERFARGYAVEPDFGDCRYKENKARRDEWRRDHAGRTLVTADDMATIEGMVHSIRGHALASRMLSGGESEVTVRWRNEESGLECKARADYYIRQHRALVDLKSTDDASPAGFPKSVANYGYHRQDAFYRDGFRAIGHPIDHFVFIAVEKLPPYAVGVYSLDEDGLAKGAASIAADLATLAKCLRDDEWPAYGGSIQTISLPRWAA